MQTSNSLVMSRSLVAAKTWLSLLQNQFQVNWSLEMVQQLRKQK